MTAMAVRVTTPEIRLHCGPTGLNEAVLSLDFLHLNVDSKKGATAVPDKPLLATGGADKEIKLWCVSEDADTNRATLEFVFSLSGHDRSVNCVRFSPNGAYLASASDDTSIILWTKPKTAGDDWRWDHISSLSDVGRTILSLGHKGDITDLSWSPDSAFLCSTSVDNRCVIWDVEKGDVAERRKDHTQYVQGVAWDPLNEFLVTESNDRTCRVYSLSGFGTVTQPDGKKQRRKFVGIQTLKTREFAAPQSGSSTVVAKGGDKESKDVVKNVEDAEGALVVAGDPAPKALAAQKHRMFLDDTCPAFSRRPAWTPDGSYFLAPTGTFRASDSSSSVNTVYAFSRGNLSQPTLHLPGQKKASLGVCCSPLLYELRRQNDQAGSLPLPNFFKTEYRSVFAVLTLDAVVIYDTQQSHPICTIKGLHYADLTDASWTADGQTLSISSTDGYLSIIQFEDGFFGTSLPRADQVALNKTKVCRMFATPKKVLKKARSQVLTQTPSKELTPAKPSLTKSRPQQVSDPITRAYQNLEGSTTANAVNLLRVRKKRKSSPALVPAAATSMTTASSTSATSAPLSSSAPVRSTESTVVDEISPSSEPASIETELTEIQPTEGRTRGGNTVDNHQEM